MPPVPALLPWQTAFLAFVAGLWAARQPLAAPAALCLLAAFLLSARRPGRELAALVPAFLAGLAAMILTLPPPPGPTPAWLADGREVDLSARVAEVEALPKGRLRLILDDLVVTDAGHAERPPGRAVLTWDAATFRPSQDSAIRLDATRLRPTGGFDNPGGPDYAWYWRLRGVVYRLYARGEKNAPIPVNRPVDAPETAPGRDRVPPGGGQDPPRTGHDHGAPMDAPGRDALEATPGRDAPPDLRQRIREAVLAGSDTAPGADPRGRALLLALVTGDRSAFAPADLELTRRASLSHALALSGQNVAMVAALGYLAALAVGSVLPSVFLVLPRQKLAVILAAPAVLGYLWLGGFAPSLLRATLMFGCFAALILLGRSRTSLDALFLALLAILAVRPPAVYDLGLVLSALAVAGIICLFGLGRDLAARYGPPGLTGKILAYPAALLWTSLCAQVALLPVLAESFGELSPNLLPNLVWLPVLGLVAMPLALSGALLSQWPAAAALGQWLLSLGAMVGEWLFRFLDLCDGLGLLGLAAVRRPTWPEIIGYYALLAAVVFKRAAGRWPVPALFLALGLLVVPSLIQTAREVRDEVRLTALDVGQGQSALLDLPGGRRVLVDGGGLAGDFDVGRAVLAPVLTLGRWPRLDLVVLTHPHHDHAGGLAYILEQFRVAAYLGNGAPAVDDPRLSAALDRGGLVERVARAGERVDLGHGLAFEVLWPEEGADLAGNDGSVVLRLVRDGRGLALLCGDIEKPVLRRLLESGRDLSAEVLLVPHHGSRASFLEAFYRRVGPKAAIISCGARNAFGYPAKEVVEGLKEVGAKVYVTGTDGAVTAAWSGPAAVARLGTTRN